MLSFLDRSGEGEQLSYFKVQFLSHGSATTQGPQGRLRLSGYIPGEGGGRSGPGQLGALAAEVALDGREERFPEPPALAVARRCASQAQFRGRRHEQSIVSSDEARTP